MYIFYADYFERFSIKKEERYILDFYINQVHIYIGLLALHCWE